MNRRTYLALAGASLTGLAGCSSTEKDVGTGGSQTSSGDATGVLATAVSDRPADIDDFEKLVVSIKEIWVHPKKTDSSESTETESGEGSPSDTTDTAGGSQPEETETKSDTEEPDSQDDEDTEQDEEEESESNTDDSEGGEEGPIRIKLDEPARADLVKLQGDAQSIISNAELPVGTYTQIKLWVGDDVDAALKSGGQADVMTPGNAPLKFNKEFEIREGTRTTFVADFSPHKRGPNGYVLKPVAEEVGVSYSEVTESGSEETTNESTTTTTDTSTSQGSE